MAKKKKGRKQTEQSEVKTEGAASSSLVAAVVTGDIQLQPAIQVPTDEIQPPAEVQVPTVVVALSPPSKELKALSVVKPESKSVESVTEQPKEPSSNRFSLIKRPDKGGVLAVRKDTLLCNHVLVNVNPQLQLFRYDVQISMVRKKPKSEKGAGDAPKKTATQKGIPIKRREENYLLFYKFAAQYPDVFGDPKEHQGRFVYDRVKFLFCSPSLDQVDHETSKPKLNTLTLFLTVEEHGGRGRSSDFTMDITYTGMVSFADFRQLYLNNPFDRNREQVQALEIFLRKCFFMNHQFTPYGRSMYDPNDKIDLGGGREMLRGFYQSINIVDGWRITLNLDVVTSAFYKMNFQPNNSVVFACELLNMRYQNASKSSFSPSDIHKLTKTFRGMKFKSMHNGFKFNCSGVTDKTARNTKFDQNGVKVTVLQYFKKEHGLDLMYADWPLLTKGTSATKISYIPMELATVIERQRVPNNQLTEKDHTQIIRASAVPPSARLQTTREMLHEARHNDEFAMSRYQLSLNMNLLEVPGRVLYTPALEYKDKGQPVQPRDGTWNMDRKQVFNAAGALKKFGVIHVVDPQRGGPSQRGRGGGPQRGGGRGGYSQRPSYGGDDVDVGQFCALLAQQAGYMGMDIGQPFATRTCNTSVFRAAYQACRQELTTIKGQKPFMLLVVPFKDTQLYGTVKYLGEHDENTSCVTQVVQETNVCRVLDNPRGQMSLLSNLVLKINAKLGGVNAKLVDCQQPVKYSWDEKKFGFAEWMSKHPVMFLGVDVTHPDPGDKRSPSIAAFSYSVDQIPYVFRGLELLMHHREEVIPHNKLADLTKAALREYHDKTKLQPKHLLYYRDGVSEGQFNEVLNKELCAVQTACLALNINYRPKVTFIIVQKRHHTRLFRKNMNPADKPARQNITPGTTVDTVITHPFEFDFFLCSHQGIQGTSKPTRYCVLYDDEGFSSDQLQHITYNLCHVYARCTRTVSLPAPVYYAHLIAFRARARLQGCPEYVASQASTERDVPLTEEEMHILSQQISVSSNQQKLMYWQ